MFSYTSHKKKNSSNRQIRRTHVTDSWEVAHKSLIFQQMLSLVYTHIHICTKWYYQLFFTAIFFFQYKRFLRNNLRGSISNCFSMFTCLITFSSISEELLASEKDFENLYQLINFVSLYKDVRSISFWYISLLNVSFCIWWCNREWHIFPDDV